MSVMGSAKAEGGRVALGGWVCAGGTPPSRVHWFVPCIVLSCAPWALARFTLREVVECFSGCWVIYSVLNGWSSGRYGLVRGRLSTAGIPVVFFPGCGEVRRTSW